jgi:excisionase family DNA binding protein
MPDWPREQFLTVAEVAELLKLNQQTIRNWLDEQKLPSLRVGRRVRVLRSDLDQFIAHGYHAGTTHAQSDPGILADNFWNGGDYRPQVSLPQTDATETRDAR